ncbi:hypothetical protein CC1G_02750 [Coprinopsis cinerea okayama7|uniref:MYND-type domain-containing protein n=1 Tax=Coprinopsis cinerea (strain Okayama-7 / 130 / ATCC MYA-4618 / FGSC 9003) TaxID=240176 RepID=A8MZU4_COPC7|nr:hypothetical protein CC1G_02750 [Coprinopsis cinerea okayama7\|eukprot:XP_001828169.2 hypothetical protein CC1G_02750 [Coprinopsis cinerea okayama7\
MTVLPRELLLAARNGDTSALDDLTSLISQQNYNLTLLDAILHHLQKPPKIQLSSRVIDYSKIAAVLDLCITALSCLGVAVLHCDRTLTYKTATVSKVSGQLYSILECIHASVLYALFRHTNGPEWRSVILRLASTLANVMDLDPSLKSPILSSETAMKIGFTLWTHTASDLQPYADPYLPNGCPVFRILRSFRRHPVGSIILHDHVLSSQDNTRNYALAFSNRVTHLSSVFTDAAGPRGSTTAMRIALDYLSDIEDLGMDLSRDPNIQAWLTKMDILKVWMEFLAQFAHRLGVDHSLIVVQHMFTAYAVGPFSNPVKAVAELSSLGLPGVVAGLLTSGTPTRRDDQRVAEMMLEYWRGYLYYPRTLGALVDEFAQMPPKVLAKVSQLRPAVQGWKPFLQELGDQEDTLTHCTLDPLRICDNLNHTTPTRRFSISKTCADCQTVVYCSPECQRQDWKSRHRTECKIMRHSRAVLRTRNLSYTAQTRAFQLQTLLSAFHGIQMGMEDRNNNAQRGHRCRHASLLHQPHFVFLNLCTFNGDNFDWDVIPIEDYPQLRREMGCHPVCPAMESRMDTIVQNFGARRDTETRLMLAIFAWNMWFRVTMVVEFAPKDGKDGWIPLRNAIQIE